MLAQTWGEFLTDIWNTEIWSWTSFWFLFVLIMMFGR